MRIVRQWQWGIGTVATMLLLCEFEGLPGVAAEEIVPVMIAQGQTGLDENEADQLTQEADQLAETGEFQDALEKYQQALAIHKELGNRAGEGFVLWRIGTLYQSQEQYSQALESYQLSLAIDWELGSPSNAAITLMDLGSVYYRLGQYQQVIDVSDRALSIIRETIDRPREQSLLNLMGLAYREMGEYQRSLELYQQALSLARELDDSEIEGTTLNNIGQVYESLAEYPQAINFYQQALAIAQETDDRRHEGIILSNLGLIYYYLGEYQQAISLDQQSATIFQESGYRADLAITLNNLGLVYEALGQYDRSLDVYQQNLLIFQEIGNLDAQGTTLNNIGSAYVKLGDYQNAIEVYEKALILLRESGDRLMEGSTLNNLGSAYSALEQYPQALEIYQQALNLQQSLENRQGEGTTLNNIGGLYNELEDDERALSYYQQALLVRQAIGDRLGTGISLNNIGASLFSTGRVSEAEQKLMEAIKIWESLRGGLTDENKVFLFDTISITYRSLQQTLIAQNKTETALEIAERGRARAFVELLALRLSGQSQEEFVPSPPPTLAQIRQVAQEQNATFVEYSLVEDQLYIWVVSPTGELGFRQVKIEDILENVSLTELVNLSRVAMGVRGRGLGVQPRDAIDIVPEEGTPAERRTSRLQQLHQLLIKPIADLLPTNPEERVIFVPQNELFLVPFPALQDANGKYLIEKHTIITVPSIQMLALTRQAKTNDGIGVANGVPLQDVLIVGNPTMPRVQLASGQNLYLRPLPGAQQEAAAIAQFLGTEALTGDAATESAVLDRLPQARIVHLATHGLLDDFGYGVPGAIALAPFGNNDGLLTSGEILDLKLNADLVVLSACDTGRGEITGDGVIGLSRSLVTAGVPSIVVSLWKVDDAATSELMQQFYRNWQASGDKAQALRQAMLTTMQQHPEPSDWAAFTLIGESE